MPADTGSQRLGAGEIAAAAKRMPNAPGVYQFIGSDGEVLYVGKALSLRKRVGGYARPGSAKLARLLAASRSIQFSRCANECEALLLENNLIKEFKPRYNVLLKDDKSYPYVRIGGGDWPRVSLYRGRGESGELFGPYAAASALRRTMGILEKAFLLRTCSDSVFANRSRPCLLHQIKRCSAPCVGKISNGEYKALVEQAKRFLRGKSVSLQESLAAEMQEAAAAQDFEKALAARNRLAALSRVQSSQEVVLAGAVKDADVVGLAADRKRIRVAFFRGGRKVGELGLVPKVAEGTEGDEVLSAFLSQFYADRPPPRLIVLSDDIADAPLQAQALSQKYHRRVGITRPLRGLWRRLALKAASEAARPQHHKSADYPSAEMVAAVANLSRPPAAIEVFDNSHLGGSGAVAAVVVFTAEGAAKSRWRCYNLKAVSGGDTMMMAEVFARRFTKLVTADRLDELPELIVIDGGKGQYNAAMRVLGQLGLQQAAVVAIAKGSGRKVGSERFYGADGEILLAANSPLRLYLTRLRDEAHRFANRGSAKRRTRAIIRSQLEDIPKIGAARRRALLNHFGSLKGVRAASEADIRRVNGISGQLAKEIYGNLHR